MSTQRSKKSLLTAVATAAVFALSGGLLAACDSPPAGGHSGHGGHEMPAVDTTKTVALYSAMRTLWDQHMQWTYDTVIAFAASSPGLDPTVDRLLQNQDDIGNAVAPFYGDEAAAQLTELLRTHITDAVPVLTAAKAGDTAALDTAVAAWYANAAEIGDFLEAANPNWAKADMSEMMKTHITQTIAYATDVLTGDYAKAIVDYDEAQSHMVEMSDLLSAGLIAQFPGKF